MNDDNTQQWPSIVSAENRLHSGGRTYRRHRTHTVPSFPFNKPNLKALTAPNLNYIILSFDILVSDAVWTTKGKNAKITAILRWFKAWERRTRSVQQNDVQIRPPQLLHDANATEFLSQLLHESDDEKDNHNHNHNENNQNVVLDENELEMLQMLENEMEFEENNNEFDENNNENENRNHNENDSNEIHELNNNNSEMELDDEDINNHENENINNENELIENHENEEKQEEIGGANDEFDDNQIVSEMSQNRDQIINNGENISLEYRQIQTLLSRHGILNLFAHIQSEGIRNIHHLSLITEDEMRDLGIVSLGDKVAMRAVLQDIQQNNIGIQIAANNNVNIHNNNQDDRYPEPTRRQVISLHKKGVGSLFAILPGLNRLPRTSGEIRHHFNNNTNNNAFRPIKQYLEPSKPSGSKEYKYAIRKVNKTNIYVAQQVGLVILSNIRDPSNNPADNGGYWSADIAYPVLIPWYNDKNPEQREIGWNYMRKYKNEVDWWLFGGHRFEQVTLRSILDWNNPPDFNVPIELNAPRIDLRTNPRP